MVARHWREWTTTANAAAYEQLLQETVLPQLRQIEGYRAATFCGTMGRAKQSLW